MVKERQPKAKNKLKKDEFDKLIDRLEKTVDAAQSALDKAALNDEIGLVAFAKVAKIISDTLQRIYQIRFGKAAQEEIMQMIFDLQRHFAMAENVAAERERRVRQKPLIEIVGELHKESEIGANIEDDEADTTARAINYQAEHESELRADLDDAINGLEN
jgi:hypothetical protein